MTAPIVRGLRLAATDMPFQRVSFQDLAQAHCRATPGGLLALSIQE